MRGERTFSDRSNSIFFLLGLNILLLLLFSLLLLSKEAAEYGSTLATRDRTALALGGLLPLLLVSGAARGRPSTGRGGSCSFGGYWSLSFC